MKKITQFAAIVFGMGLVLGLPFLISTSQNVEAAYQPIGIPQVVSSGNSQVVTSSEASPASPWVGTWETTRANGYVRQLVTVVGSTSAIPGTFTFEYSEDCSTATISESRQIDDFDTLRDFDLINAGACFRVQFEPDGAMGGNSVIITTTYLRTYQGPFVRLGNQEIEEQNAAMGQTFAYLKGFRTGGKSIGITATRGGAMLTARESVEIARGNVPGSMSVGKFGKNPDVDTTGTPEDIYLGSSIYAGFPTGSPETIECFSASANDTSAGTGMRTLRFEGLPTSSSTEYSGENLTLNGTTAVTSSGTWYRVNRVYGLTAGSGGTNAGLITCRHTTTTANVFATVAAGSGQSAIAVYTVPDATTLFITALEVQMGRASGAAGSCNIALQTRAFGSGMWRNRRDWEMTDAVSISPKMDFPLIISEQTDLRFRALSCSDNNSIITAQFEGALVDD